MGRGHGHDIEGSSDRSLVLAVGLNVLLTAAQIAGGLVSGSLSLIADALHNMNDAATLGLALAVRRIGRRPPDSLRTFGYRKAETVGALISTTALMLIGCYLLYEAAARWLSPTEVSGWPVVLIACAALLVDSATAWLTFRAQDESLNLRAAFLHNVADALGSLGVAAAGVLILLFGWHGADVVAAAAIALYVLWQSFGLMKQAIRVLMASVPPDIDLEAVVEAMTEVQGIADVHHVHIWQMDEQRSALEAHVVVTCRTLAESEEIKRALKLRLEERFGIGHSTLELETHTWPHCEGTECL